ncbi:hypothetical protein ACFY8X_20455 [Streptomyces tanashiensis]
MLAWNVHNRMAELNTVLQLSEAPRPHRRDMAFALIIVGVQGNAPSEVRGNVHG